MLLTDGYTYHAAKIVQTESNTKQKSIFLILNCYGAACLRPKAGDTE